MTASSRQLRRSDRLKVIVVIGPSCSTRKFSVILRGSLFVCFTSARRSRATLKLDSIGDLKRIAVGIGSLAKVQAVFRLDLAEPGAAFEQRLSGRRDVGGKEDEFPRPPADRRSAVVQRNVAVTSVEFLPAGFVFLLLQAEHVAVESDHGGHVGGEYDDALD